MVGYKDSNFVVGTHLGDRDFDELKTD